MKRRSRGLVWVLVGASAWALACRGPAGPEVPERPSIAVDSDIALSLRKRADGFYLRLAHRRFNSLETYNDRIMREHFRSPALFLDYYADLAQAFADAHFEKRRPQRIEIQELRFEDPATAQVEIRFVGSDDRPLRPGEVQLVRIDRWERNQGNWWVQPGKL